MGCLNHVKIWLQNSPVGDGLVIHPCCESIYNSNQLILRALCFGILDSGVKGAQIFQLQMHRIFLKKFWIADWCNPWSLIKEGVDLQRNLDPLWGGEFQLEWSGGRGAGGPFFNTANGLSHSKLEPRPGCVGANLAFSWLRRLEL